MSLGDPRVMTAVVGVFIYEHRKLRALPPTCPAPGLAVPTRKGPHIDMTRCGDRPAALTTNDPPADGQSLAGGRWPGLASGATRRIARRVDRHAFPDTFSYAKADSTQKAVYNVNCGPYFRDRPLLAETEGAQCGR